MANGYFIGYEILVLNSSRINLQIFHAKLYIYVNKIISRELLISYIMIKYINTFLSIFIFVKIY